MKKSANDLPAAPERASRATGMTLVELLLALAIAALIMGLAFCLYGGVLRSSRSRDQSRRARSDVASALGLLGNDIASCAAVDSSDAAFVLPPATNACGAPLSFALAVPSAAGNGPGFYDIVKVQYVLEDDDSRPGKRDLVRKIQPLKREGASGAELVAEVLAEDIEVFQIEVFDGANWTNSWGARPDDGAPEAARIRLAARRDRASGMASEILIPAGQNIKGADEQDSRPSGAF